MSPTHATEILTPDGGFGLDAALRHRWAAVSGILNGIDTTVWDPETDAALVANYSAGTKKLERALARAINRAAIRERAGFADDDVPLAVMVSRLTGQKGADLLVPIVPILRSIPLRLFVLGSGEAEIAGALAAAADAESQWFSFVDGYDDALAHLLHGGADLLLVPSRFEPCGLTQMQAMRYGAIPVVTDVGGLHDTVVDADERPRRHRLPRSGGVSGGVHVGVVPGVAPPRHRPRDRQRLVRSGDEARLVVERRRRGVRRPVRTARWRRWVSEGRANVGS